MSWKWLFIYPMQQIASVNLVEFPVHQPVHFYITSDAPMNSFWLPQLSGQIYAMPGMQTQLNLAASVKGTFTGWSANISGRGFAGMIFHAKSVSTASFNSWVKSAKQQSPALTLSRYDSLSKPSMYNRVATYSNPASNLFNDIIFKYMVDGYPVQVGVAP